MIAAATVWSSRALSLRGYPPTRAGKALRKVGHQLAMTDSGLTLIFLELRPALLRFLMARGVSVAEAEDVLQDVYLKLRAEPGGPVASPRAYLYRVVSNRLLDLRRVGWRRSQRELDWAGASAGVMAEADDRPAADALLIGRQRLAAVQRALDALPERTAAIFSRFRIDGWPQKDIAADYGISISAVEKHLQRAYRVVLDARAGLDAEVEPPQRLGAE